ncbi:hypothetical protein [Halodesulfovibrio sp.]|jgi:hypothetical protein|uniref:hypothetical protein n=1 Tax=Halodesulfovibrio sp. TaxID=1912772 RepID=UPI0025ED0B35|nr:hypothetical protein [Halodesulfovibrio sp.]MCT4627947.1 hypothetical protein [Halodesulfovibrio sp.]
MIKAQSAEQFPFIESITALPKAQQERVFVECLDNRRWRLNNLYWIQDKNGKVVRFRFNWAQETFYNERWFRNVILKARQLGFTTFMTMLELDAALFGNNIKCGLIAQDLDAAEAIFNKITFAYDQLAPAIRDAIPTVRSQAKMLEFKNGSSIRVGTSFRSGTLQYLHISEFGKICAERPDRAKEIVTGAIEAVPQDGMVSIESTAEGQQGYFYDYCERGQELARQEAKLTHLDYKFFFFPWWKNPEYVIREQHPVAIPQDMAGYFDELNAKHQIGLHPAQKAWYALKAQNLGADMKREYPATPEEAFEKSIEGAYFRTEFMKLYERRQITKVPVQEGALTYTFWDLGMNDCMAIWFVQLVGREVRVIDYYENNHEGLGFYANKLREKGYNYGGHYAPHDIEVQEMATGKTRKESAAEKGISFVAVPRIQDKRDSIEAARRILPQCWFDEEHCATGLDRLKNYRKAYNPRTGAYQSHPLHDINSNGADAFQTFAMGFEMMSGGTIVHAKPQPVTDTSGWC